MTIMIPSALFAVSFCAAAAMAAAQPAATPGLLAKPDIVLVHGAFADGTSWSKVIMLLQARGYHVVSVQNPTTSLADDVAATERVLNQQAGPVVLCGHSWAGVVITQAGNHSKVKALVYVDASAPDSGQSITDAASAFPPPPGAGAAVKDENGYLTLPDAAVQRYFAQDLSRADQGIISAVQIPWLAGCLTDKVTHAAWREKPSWWVIGQFDHMIAPELQVRMAATIKAKVTKLPTGHLAMLADPQAVTDVIISAAESIAPEKDPATNAPARTPPLGSGSTLAEPSGFAPAPVVPLASEAPARLIVDAPLPAQLATGYVVLRYRAENARILPVYGPAALDIAPLIGHLHVTVDDSPWHWLDASGEPISINGLLPGPHQILIELETPAHKVIDSATVTFEIPQRRAVAP